MSKTIINPDPEKGKKRSLNISVSSRTYSGLKQMSDNHDILSHSDNPKVTTTARGILELFCALDKLHGVQELKDAEGMSLSEIIRRGVYRQLDDFNATKK